MLRNYSIRWIILLVSLESFTLAQCAKDNRADNTPGILVTDFTITGTQAVSATDLAAMTGGFVGNCYNDDSEEMGERVRAEFQNRGYFKMEVKNLSLKPSDPLGSPKPVVMQADVDEGPIFKLGEITFLNNHAFSSDELRDLFPLKKGEVFARSKIASGLESLRKSYGSKGYLDFTCMPDTEFSKQSMATLKVEVQEGSQYHMGKVEVTAEKRLADRIRLQWKLREGSVYDANYPAKFIDDNRALLPDGFSRERVQVAKNCPDALVDVRLAVDEKESAKEQPLKDVPCEKKDKEETSK